MSVLDHILSRRALVRGVVQLGLLYLLPWQRVTVAAYPSAPTQGSAYGQGSYGQHSYPGLQIIFLPIANKEDS
jgi:hypothetical protein